MLLNAEDVRQQAKESACHVSLNALQLHYTTGGGMRRTDLHRTNLRIARARWNFKRGDVALQILKHYSQEYRFSLLVGDLLFLDQGWYVTHAGLVRLSHRRRCRGIE